MSLIQGNIICICTTLEYYLVFVLFVNLWTKEGFLPPFTLWVHDREGDVPSASTFLFCNESAKSINLIRHLQ